MFARPGGGWGNGTQTAKLTAADGAANDELGYSVAVSADGAAIAAGADGSNSYQGAAYVFVKPVGGWGDGTQTAKLTAADGAAGDYLGDSVAASADGSTIVAGAPAAQIGSNASQGAAYVFGIPCAITVTTNADSGVGSLRQAIADVCPSGTITFDSNYTITLSSELTISQSLTIDAQAHAIKVSGNNATRVFNVTAGNVMFAHLTIAEGKVTTTDCGSTSGSYCGGGIMLQSNSVAVTVTNSTLVGNSASLGGGIYNNGTLTVINSTLSSNSASSSGGGIYNNATLNLANNVIANSVSGRDCVNGGTLGTNINNLVMDGSCSASLSGDPLLGALDGGSTWTMALLPGSPAIDVGDDAICAEAPVHGLDQRGVARPQGAHCDIGAYESRGFTLTKAGGDNQATSITAAFAAPLAVSVASAYTEPVNGGQVAFAGPLSGAGVTPITQTATITSGTASVNISANGTPGSYSVNANTSGALAPVAYALTNTANYLTIVTAGTGTGVVTPTVGLHFYLSGTIVILQATPNTGSSFGGWSGNADCTDGSVTMDADKSCTAAFAINTYTITPTWGAGGSITPGTAQTVNYGDSLTFTIAANTGYRIVDVGVDGASVGVTTSYTFNNVQANHTITAAFALNVPTTFTLMVATAGTGTGLVTPTVGAHVYAASSTVWLTATANAGSTFAGWSGAASGLTNPISITLDANKTITATFDQSILCTPVGGPSLTYAPWSPQVGQMVTFTGTVSAGTTPITYTWAWGDGTPGGVGATLSHAFPLTITAQSYTVTLNVSNACSGPVVATQVVAVTPQRIFLPLALR